MIVMPTNPDEETQDAHAARVRHVLGGQIAPQAPDGGVRILYRCNTCGRAWLQEGSSARVRLEQDELAALAEELGADLGTLPYATCRICVSATLGELSIDCYGAGGAGGYGVSAELTQPTGAHLLCTAIRVDWLMRQRTAPHAGVVTNFPHCRAWLAWLERVRMPLQYHRIDDRDSAALGTTNPPGHGATGTAGWTWRGAIWQERIGTLGGLCVVTLAQAIPPDEPYSMALIFACWHELARIVQAGNIAGETGRGKQ